MDSRIQWIDIEKGIAILLMVIGHSSLPPSVSNFIYAFHMPVFFILSGVCSNYERDTIIKFILKRFMAIILPFICYSIIVLCLCHYMGIYDVSTFIKKGWGGFALWFIPVFYLSSVLVKVLVKIMKLDLGGLKICIVILLIVGESLSILNIKLPWSLCSIPVSAAFIMIGNIFKAQIFDIVNRINIFMIIIFALIVFVISFFFPFDLAWNKVSPIILTVTAAVLGTLMLGGASRILNMQFPKCSRILTLIGQETYAIMALSQILSLLAHFLFGYGSILNNIFMIVMIVVFVCIKNKSLEVIKKINNKFHAYH